MWFVYMWFVYFAHGLVTCGLFTYMVVFHWFVSRNFKINIAVRMYLPGVW